MPLIDWAIGAAAIAAVLICAAWALAMLTD